MAVLLVACVDGRDDPASGSHGAVLPPPGNFRGNIQFPGGGGGGGADGVGGAPGQSCDTVTGCDACSACAVLGPCAGRATSCQADPRCLAALDCLQGCESGCNFDDPTCQQQCAVNCNDGSGAIQQAANLIDCACDLTCSCAPEERGACAAGLLVGPT